MRILVSLAFALILCRPAAAATLFDDLGGLDGVKRIVGDTMDLAVADPRIKAAFDDTNLPRLKDRLAEQFCVIAGGPCVYHGHDMAKAHRPLHLTDADFNALAEDLETAMERADIGFATQARLLALLAPMERDIVER